MESCDADVIEIGGDEADATASSLHELNTKVETGLTMFVPHLATVLPRLSRPPGAPECSISAPFRLRV